MDKAVIQLEHDIHHTGTTGRFKRTKMSRDFIGFRESTASPVSHVGRSKLDL